MSIHVAHALLHLLYHTVSGSAIQVKLLLLSVKSSNNYSKFCHCTLLQWPAAPTRRGRTLRILETLKECKTE